MFIIFIGVMVSWICVQVTNQIHHFKCMQFSVCPLHFKKAIQEQHYRPSELICGKERRLPLVMWKCF